MLGFKKIFWNIDRLKESDIGDGEFFSEMLLQLKDSKTTKGMAQEDIDLLVGNLKWLDTFSLYISNPLNAVEEMWCNAFEDTYFRMKETLINCVLTQDQINYIFE